MRITQIIMNIDLVGEPKTGKIRAAQAGANLGDCSQELAPRGLESQAPEGWQPLKGTI